METPSCRTCTEFPAGNFGAPRTPPLISLILSGLWDWLVGGTVDSERTPVTQTQSTVESSPISPSSTCRVKSILPHR